MAYQSAFKILLYYSVYHYITFYCLTIFHGKSIPHFTYPLISYWAFRLFPLLGCYEQLSYKCLYTNFCGCMFSFLLEIELKVELLSHMVTLLFLRTYKLLSKMNEQCKIFTRDLLKIQFLHILTNTCYFLPL